MITADHSDGPAAQNSDIGLETRARVNVQRTTSLRLDDITIRSFYTNYITLIINIHACNYSRN